MSPELHLAAALSAWEVHGSKDTGDGLEGRMFSVLCRKSVPLQVGDLKKFVHSYKPLSANKVNVHFFNVFVFLVTQFINSVQFLSFLEQCTLFLSNSFFSVVTKS